MPEAVDIFADAVHIHVMPFGCTLQFGVSRPVPMTVSQPGAPAAPPPTSPPELLPSDRLATIRLTPEFLKAVAYLLRQHVLGYEKTSGFKIELPPAMMALVLVGSSREQWDQCWGYTK